MLPELLLWGDEAGVEDVGKSCAADIKYSPRCCDIKYWARSCDIKYWASPVQEIGNIKQELASIGKYWANPVQEISNICQDAIPSEKFLLGIVSIVSFYFVPQENLTTKMARLGTYYVCMGLYGCS